MTCTNKPRFDSSGCSAAAFLERFSNLDTGLNVREFLNTALEAIGNVALRPYIWRRCRRYWCSVLPRCFKLRLFGRFRWWSGRLVPGGERRVRDVPHGAFASRFRYRRCAQGREKKGDPASEQYRFLQRCSAVTGQITSLDHADTISGRNLIFQLVRRHRSVMLSETAEKMDQ